MVRVSYYIIFCKKTNLSNIVLMSLIFGIDVNSQLAKDIASLGLGFSQGKQLKLKHNTSKTFVFFCCLATSNAQFRGGFEWQT